MGRPSEYKEEYNELAYKFCLLGATDKQMADFFDVSEVTLNAWKKKYPEFLKSLKEGKIPADANVAASLYKRACGYRYDEITYEKVKPSLGIKLSKGEVTEVKAVDSTKIKIVEKEIVPDTAACMIWLKNRADWKDSREGGGLGENAAEHFKAIAEAIVKKDMGNE